MTYYPFSLALKILLRFLIILHDVNSKEIYLWQYHLLFYAFCEYVHEWLFYNWPNIRCSLYSSVKQLDFPLTYWHTKF